MYECCTVWDYYLVTLYTWVSSTISPALLLHYDLERAFVNAYKTRIKSEILKRGNMKYVNELFIKDEVSIPQDHQLCCVGVITIAVC